MGLPFERLKHDILVQTEEQLLALIPLTAESDSTTGGLAACAFSADLPNMPSAYVFLPPNHRGSGRRPLTQTLPLDRLGSTKQ